MTSTVWKLDRVPVSQVMTRSVVSVPGTASYPDVLAVLADHNVGAVPVVDAERRVLGLISESDLLAKLAAAPDIGGHTPSRTRGPADLRRKAAAETALELMSTPVVTVSGADSVVATARLTASLGLRRVPVVDADQRLVGIVTRSDLLRAFRKEDEEIRSHVLKAVVREEFCLPPGTVNVRVQEGVVTLTGELERAQVIPTLVAAVSGISGVVAVRDHLSFPHSP